MTFGMLVFPNFYILVPSLDTFNAFCRYFDCCLGRIEHFSSTSLTASYGRLTQDMYTAYKATLRQIAIYTKVLATAAFYPIMVTAEWMLLARFPASSRFLLTPSGDTEPFRTLTETDPLLLPNALSISLQLSRAPIRSVAKGRSLRGISKFYVFTLCSSLFELSLVLPSDS